MSTLALSISEAEWKVMRVVWASPNATSRHIIDTLQPLLEWNDSTIKSLLARLCHKELLIKHTHTKPFTYQASITQEEAIVSLTLHKLNQTCNKQRGVHLQRILAHSPLSKSDCDLLIQQLHRIQQDAPKHIACNCQQGQCTCCLLNRKEHLS